MKATSVPGEAHKSNRKAKAAQAIREQQRQYRCETLRFARHLGGDDGRAQRPRETRVGARAHRRAQLGLQAGANVIVFAQAARKVIAAPRGPAPPAGADTRATTESMTPRAMFSRGSPLPT